MEDFWCIFSQTKEDFRSLFPAICASAIDLFVPPSKLQESLRSFVHFTPHLCCLRFVLVLKCGLSPCKTHSSWLQIQLHCTYILLSLPPFDVCPGYTFATNILQLPGPSPIQCVKAPLLTWSRAPFEARDKWNIYFPELISLASKWQKSPAFAVDSRLIIDDCSKIYVHIDVEVRMRTLW